MLESKKVLVPVAGYLLISAFSFAAGGILGTIHGLSPIPISEHSSGKIFFILQLVATNWLNSLMSNGPENVIFFFILTAIFVFAVRIMVEGQKDDYNDDALLREKVYHARIAIILLMACFIIYILSRYIFAGRPLNYNDFFRDATLCLAMIIPSLFWLFATKRIISNESDVERDSALRFTNRVYYPSIFACTIPFLYGWMLSISAQANSHLVVLFVSLIITAIYVYSIRWTSANGGPSATIFNSVIVGFIFFSPVISLVTDAAHVNALLFSIVLAFSLGVAEVSQRVYSHTAGTRFQANDQKADYYERGANWSTTVLIPSVPIFAFFETNLPVWFLSIYSIFFLIIWLLTKKIENPFYSWFAIGMGFLLPAWICLGAMIGLAYPNLIGVVEAGSIGSDLGFLTLIAIAAAIAIKVDGKNLNEIFQNTLNYNSKRDSLLIFILVSIVFLTYTTFVAAFVHHFVEDKVLWQRKIYEMQVFMTILSIIALALYVFVTRNPPRGDSQGSELGIIENNKNLPEGKNATFRSGIEYLGSTLWNLTLMGRPAISAIAGLSVIFFVFDQQNFINFIMVLSFISMTFLTMFGFIVNDIFDLPKDIVGHRRDKFLVVGRVSRVQAQYFAIGLLGVAAVCGALAGGVGALYVVSTISIALTFYSQFSQNWPWAKGFYTASLCMAPLPMAEAIVGTAFVPIYIYLFGLVYISGRELLFDAVDFDADKLAGLKTLAILIGRSRSVLIAWLIMACSFAFLLPAVDELGMFWIGTSVFFIAIFAWIGRSRLLLASNLTRINVFLGVMAVTNALG